MRTATRTMQPSPRVAAPTVQGIAVPVGSVTYRVTLTEGMILHKNEKLYGLCSAGRQSIQISSDLLPERRLNTLWHELAHAWLIELDPAQQATHGDETVANIVGLGLSQVSPDLFARLHRYMMTGDPGEGGLAA